MTSSSPPAAGWMRTVPGLMRVSNGMCSGRMPSSPPSPGAMTIEASPEKIEASALTISTCNVFAIWVFPGNSSLLQRLGLLENLLDRADHVEGLFGEAVALAVHDHVEALDRVLQGDVFPWGAGEYLGHVERLREEALDL